MSLIAWYPLNGNLRNIGTDGEDLTPFEGTPTYVDGKTGKAVYFSSDNVNQRLTRSLFLKQNNFSWCIWVKPKLLTTNTVHYAVCNGRADFNLDGWGLGFSQNMSTAKVECGSLRYSFTPKLDMWTHVTFTINENNIATIYMNGIKVHQSSVSTLPDFSEGSLFALGCFEYAAGDIYPMSGCLCDFRYYDHCLTQSEVSEIAKGLMLHYSFENPYAEETTNIPHSITKNAYPHITLGSDNVGNYFTKSTGAAWYEGIQLNNVPVVGGRYYTWSMEVMPIKDIEYVIEGNAACLNSEHAGSNDSHFSAITRNSDYRRLEAYKWNKIFVTVKIKSECSNPTIFCTFCPTIPNGDTEVKVYYRNSLLEEKPYDTPYTSSSREAGLIRDNSGMGNDGTQVYQREEIPIISSPVTGNGVGAGNLTITENSGTYTITNFKSTDNQCVTLGKINYNSRYHYLNSLVSYEFDITLKNLVMADGKTLSDASSSNNYPSMMQGMVHFKDGTSSWTNNPSSDCFIAKRLNDGKTANGTFHICHEKKITNQACLTNALYYDLGFRFNYIKSGTVIISNLHAYYQNLDTSTLSITDNSAVGTHSAYFNGKNFINAGVVTPDYMDELTLSCWVYRDDWTKVLSLPQYSSIMGNRDIGGFAFNIDANQKIINFCTRNNSNNYNYAGGFDMSTFTSGWHLLTGVATKNKISIYIDGKLHKENQHNQNISINNLYNNTTNKVPFIIGSEIDNWNTTPNYTNIIDFYIDDIRLYPIALSPEDIKALYNVKTKIDNKSNLYCNQLVETKSENMMKPLNEVDLNNDLAKFYSSGTFSCKDNILKYTISTSNTNYNSGMYIRNVNYGGPLIDNLEYRCTFYVKVSKTGTYVLGEERLGCVIKTLESGKWYYIKQEAKATGSSKNLTIYNASKNLETGDIMEVRDVQMYRLYDDENYNPGPNIKGQYKTFELNETFNEDVENSGATIVDKYGAEWLEVFYHNNNNGTIYFANETEALHTNSQYKFSILDQLENFRGTDNKFEFLLEYPTDLPNQYLRWKQADNPVETTDTSSKNYDSTAFVNGYELIHTDWNDSFEWSGLISSNNNRSLLDGVIGTNWWYSIGSYNSYTESGVTGVPGPRQNTRGIIIPNDTHLYVRIDNLPNKNEIFRQYKRQTKTKEIIEI